MTSYASGFIYSVASETKSTPGPSCTSNPRYELENGVKILLIEPFISNEPISRTSNLNVLPSDLH